MNDVVPVRRWIEPEPRDDWAAMAARIFPNTPAAEGIAALQGWNPHVFYRPSSISLTCSDVIFIEPSAAG